MKIRLANKNLLKCKNNAFRNKAQQCSSYEIHRFMPALDMSLELYV